MLKDNYKKISIMNVNVEIGDNNHNIQSEVAEIQTNIDFIPSRFFITFCYKDSYTWATFDSKYGVKFTTTGSGGQMLDFRKYNCTFDEASKKIKISSFYCQYSLLTIKEIILIE